MDVNVPESMTPWVRADAGSTTPAESSDDLTVGGVASLVGVSIRTLHYWDSIGLVEPSGRTPAGYRTYSAADVERVHRVLVYQELGLSLAKIASLLDDPDIDEAQQLRQQRRLLGERITRLNEMAHAVDQVIAAQEAGTVLTAQERAEIFGHGWRKDWDEEAHQRWGESDEWSQFEQNAAGLSAAGREKMRASGDALHADLAAAKRFGLDPSSGEANRLAERHRGMIGQLFACTRSMHVCLGRMYVGDERFCAQLDGLEPGLSVWLKDVIDANARANGVDPDHAVWE